MWFGLLRFPRNGSGFALAIGGRLSLFRWDGGLWWGTITYWPMTFGALISGAMLRAHSEMRRNLETNLFEHNAFYRVALSSATANGTAQTASRTSASN